MKELQERHEDTVSKIKSFESSVKDAKKQMANLNKEHNWIAKDKHQFG